MARKKRQSNPPKKPGDLTGFLFAGLFAGLLLVNLYTGSQIFAYLSAVPAVLLLMWFLARFL